MYKCTTKQKEVLDLLVRGYKYTEIAKKLDIKLMTVRERIISFCKHNKIPMNQALIVSYYLLTEMLFAYLQNNSSQFFIIQEKYNEIIAANRFVGS